MKVWRVKEGESYFLKSIESVLRTRGLGERVGGGLTGGD